ncbi:hypothetical protein Tcan_00248 [Toxocara canis]|uniref:Uncharacterized protein n=1 Tax=Toxocara canis TaxID=6265 RepID=A0A0B2UVB9_TOXCA|nr:hypothetical protein Tcan_00248 [Toxocara canis]
MFTLLDLFQIKWMREDEEGFYFEVCCLRLKREPAGALFTLVRSLLNDRTQFCEKAANSEAQMEQMRNQLEKLDKRASEMCEFCNNLESTLISKFTTILNEKLKKT